MTKQFTCHDDNNSSNERFDCHSPVWPRVQEESPCSTKSWRRRPCFEVVTFERTHRTPWGNSPARQRDELKPEEKGVSGGGGGSRRRSTRSRWARSRTSSCLLSSSVASSVSCAKRSVRNFSSSWYQKGRRGWAGRQSRGKSKRGERGEILSAVTTALMLSDSIKCHDLKKKIVKSLNPSNVSLSASENVYNFPLGHSSLIFFFLTESVFQYIRWRPKLTQLLYYSCLVEGAAWNRSISAASEFINPHTVARWSRRRANFQISSGTG